MESLLLIYADFRVRALRDEAGREHTKIYSLEDSYSIIHLQAVGHDPGEAPAVRHRIRQAPGF